MSVVDTPNQKTIEEVCSLLKVEPAQTVKTLLVRGRDDDGEPEGVVALVVRGDHELNTIKAEKLPGVYAPLTMASDEEIRSAVGCSAGSIGPVQIGVPLIVDREAAHLADFVSGANEDGKHLTGVNWARDLPEPEVADIRNVVEGDPSPDGQGTLTIKRGIEVGHIFQLGDKYSKSMDATVLDENGRNIVMTMGCYGIGVSRVVAAAIEQNHDDKGIIWPDAIAPFHIALCPINPHKSAAARETAEKFYGDLSALGYHVLLDDRGERPGVMFADMELIGIPHRVVISDRGLEAGTVEYKGRRDAESQHIALNELQSFLCERIKAN